MADACSSDASYAIDFDEAVNKYLKDKSIENQKGVSRFFEKWIIINNDLIALSANAPLIQPILPLSKSLSDISEQFLLRFDKNQTLNPAVLNDLLEQCNSKKHADVELAVYNSLKKLL